MDISPKTNGKAQRSLMFILLLILIGLGIFLVQFYENGLPPVVKAEVGYNDTYLTNDYVYLKGSSWRIPADESFTLRLKANEPTRYAINYGNEGQTSPKPVRKFETSFQTVRGQQIIEVVAEDRARNIKTYEYNLLGVPLLQPLIRAPREGKPGYPISVQMVLPPQSYGVTLAAINITLNGQALKIFSTPKDVVALSAIPLEGNAESYLLNIELIDIFGREVGAERIIEIEPDSQITQTLDLPIEILDLRTPENLQVEDELIQETYKTSENSLPLWIEPFIYPIEGSFNTTSGFGAPRIYGELGDFAYHTGLDASAPIGTSVAATNDGIAVIVGYYPIRGGFIMLDHGAGVFSLYFHLETFYISVGDKVSRGESIGEVGNTGLSTGPHLHWEMRVHNTPTAPSVWVDQVFP